MKFVQFFSCAAIAIFLAARADAATLYASTAAGAAGELYILNAANGAMVQDVGPLNDASSVNYPITGLAFHPTTGVLYGSTGNSGATQATLVKINPATAQVTLIGAFNAGPVNSSGSPATMADLAFDSAGNLYGVASIGGPSLYSINTITGQATLVGANGVSSSTSGGALGISAGGVFYGSPTSSRFGTYDSGTGAYTNIANPAKPAGTGAYTAFDFDGSTLYGLNTGPGSPPPTHLVTIDATGTVTDLGASVNSLDAIAFAPVPEPSTVALLFAAAGAVGCLETHADENRPGGQAPPPNPSKAIGKRSLLKRSIISSILKGAVVKFLRLLLCAFGVLHVASRVSTQLMTSTAAGAAGELYVLNFLTGARCPGCLPGPIA